MGDSSRTRCTTSNLKGKYKPGGDGGSSRTKCTTSNLKGKYMPGEDGGFLKDEMHHLKSKR